MNIPNPKRDKSSTKGRSGWYPYYAGFSASFAQAIVEGFAPSSSSKILDPWNGSGTTTAVSAALGITSFGFDLNPVMAVVARARLLSKRERASLMPLAKAIVSSRIRPKCDVTTDPLSVWFSNNTICAIRQIESGVLRLLTCFSDVANFSTQVATHEFSDLAALYYVAMFRTVRSFLSSLQSSNPTWIKVPNEEKKITVEPSQVRATFLKEVEQMAHLLNTDEFDRDSAVKIGIASSTNLPIESNSIDYVLTSPPYCTRIDYAAATRVELAILGIGNGDSYNNLRKELIGTPTVPRKAPEIDDAWGTSCAEFLKKVRVHPSRASGTYYYKGLCQYFDSLNESIAEISRILRPNGKSCIVVQDSYYKELHIDLSKICEEISNHHNLILIQKEDFRINRMISAMNSKSKAYRKNSCATESVLVLTKVSQ